MGLGKIESACKSLLKRLGILAADGTYSGGLSGLGSADNAVVRTDGTGGDRVQGSSVTVDDSGNLVVPASAGVVIGGATSSGIKFVVGSPESGLNLLLGNGTTVAHYAGLRASRQLVMGGANVKVDTTPTFGLAVANDLQIGFSSSTSADGAKDTGLKRAAAGVVQVTDGGSGGGALRVGTYTVATLPSASTVGAGTIAYVSNGAAGSPVLAFSDGADWLRCDTLAAVSSS